MRRPVRALLVLLLVVTGSEAVAARPTIPPPTPVPPDGSPSPYPTALDTPPPSAEPPRLPVESAVLADLDSGRVLVEQRPGLKRPIASLTKIMTGLLVIERSSPEDVVTASPLAAEQAGAELGLEPGEELPVRDLLLALLLQSANDAAVALAEHVAGSVEAFVELMNRRAAELGMERTRFASPSGLDDSGYSTAADLAALSTVAFSDPVFADVVGTRFHEVPAPEGDPRSIQNRNALLWLYEGTVGGKTGYTAAAGFCLVAVAEREDLRLVSVVLGGPEQAFDEGAAILNHGFQAWERRTLVAAGQRLEPVEVDGTTVPVSAAESLAVLVERGEQVEVDVEVSGALSLPVSAGEELGVVVASADGEELGEVPLTAVSAVSAPGAAAPSDEDVEPSWWRSWWEAFSGLSVAVFDVLSDRSGARP